MRVLPFFLVSSKTGYVATGECSAAWHLVF
jgi:hypothetical protein